jgi:hypothetical protein
MSYIVVLNSWWTQYNNRYLYNWSESSIVRGWLDNEGEYSVPTSRFRSCSRTSQLRVRVWEGVRGCERVWEGVRGWGEGVRGWGWGWVKHTTTRFELAQGSHQGVSVIYATTTTTQLFEISWRRFTQPPTTWWVMLTTTHTHPLWSSPSENRPSTNTPKSSHATQPPKISPIVFTSAPSILHNQPKNYKICILPSTSGMLPSSCKDLNEHLGGYAYESQFTAP